MNFESLKKLHDPGFIICRIPGNDDAWGVFADPLEIVNVTSCSEVKGALDLIDSKTREDGLFAAGYVAYEAAGGLDSACSVLENKHPVPLIYFGLYKKPYAVITSEDIASCGRIIRHKVSVSPIINRNDYETCINRVHHHIREGDIYQANFTFRADGALPTDIEPLDFFFSLFRGHPVPYAAYINDGSFCHVSLSPELFLEKIGHLIRSCPMKGTAPRAGESNEDRRIAESLPSDPKNTAENLMIVDMVRNDLGRVCRKGSITVDPLFSVESYRTVHQMVSTVHGEIYEKNGLADIFHAAFPAASITGAPKFRAMQIIRELENVHRGIYTGCIGCIVPGGDFLFNVAIRTITCSGSRFRLGIGGGIVHDSSSISEWEEALLKSHFLDSAGEEDFCILETMLYQPGKGTSYLAEHIARAKRSQLYFGRKWRKNEFEKALADCISGITVMSRIRMTIDRNGLAQAKAFPLTENGWGIECAKLTLSHETTSKNDVFLYHKTTRRKFYDDARHIAVENAFDEIIFTNEDGFVTEGSITNLFIRHGSQWSTPELPCGLLDGIWRRNAIADLCAIERKITTKELLSSDEILIGNSVRGGVRATII